MKKNIFGIKLTGDFKIKEESYIIILETLTKVNIDKIDEFITIKFTKINNETVIKIDDTEKVEIIKWHEYQKYRLAKLDRSNLKTWYDATIDEFNGINRHGYTSEQMEEFKHIPWITYDDFVPCAEKFDTFCKERDEIKIRILGIDDFVGLDEKEYKFKS